MPETLPARAATPKSDFASQYRRIFEAAGCRTQHELAVFLDIRQSSISDAKRRHSIPTAWLIKLFEKKRINPEWIRTGQGGRRLHIPQTAGDTPPVLRITVERRPPEDCSTDELMAEVVRRALKGFE